MNLGRYPQHLDRRERTVFAWLPMRASDGNTYWLERMRVSEVYNDFWFDGHWTTESVVRAAPPSDREGTRA